MERHLYLTLVESLNSSMNGKSCWSKMFLCLSSSFIGAVLTVYYLLPASYSVHQLSIHHQHQNFLKTGRCAEREVVLNSTVRAEVGYMTSAMPVTPRTGNGNIVILYWNTFFGMGDFDYGFGRTPFLQCDTTNQTSDRGDCITTNDRRLLNDSHAILFHVRNLNIDDLPPAQWRRPHQNYVFLLYESPVHTDLKMLRQPLFRNYFNRTMTYRRDSDFVDLHQHGRMQCIDAASPSCTELPRNTKDETIRDHPNATSVPVEMDLSMKNRTIAWLVSHCWTIGRRESLARNLSQFIPVDIYGTCGHGKHQCPNETACNLAISRHYRFYLSFENSLCLDYVTEKVYRPLQHDAIPVVYGGADYSLYLPAGSYVNAMDFDSPERLADHLNKLMVDDELYLTYFRWKAKYVVKNKPKDGMCQLCRLLRHPETNKDKSYADIAAWWAGGVNGTNQTCQHPPTKLVG